MKTNDEYLKIVNSLKRRKKGATVADICASTALPLSIVRELLLKAADEYSGHLKVTESGELLYYFPDGFTSRYRGLGAGLKKAFVFFKTVIKAVSVFLFKVWIMLMLIGYFTLFMALALASILLQIAAQSKSSSSNRGGTAFAGPNLFGLIWRIWFFSEITKPRYGGRPVTHKKKNTRPMHKAIFSFVFGDEDPNKDWEDQKSKAIITYLQANRGVISLAEYMIFTGENSLEAEKSILTFCSKYGGSPEVTEEGTIVYRFDELLLGADSKNFEELSPPIKRLKDFSSNSKNMNTWFVLINMVNLIFGSYFLYNAMNTGFLFSPESYQSASYLYAFTHAIFEMGITNPVAFISIVLGIIPLIFSILFWLIPLARYYFEKDENAGIKFSNFRHIAYGKIWASPVNIDTQNLQTSIPECVPSAPVEAGEKIIKEFGAISPVDVEQTEDGKILYSFNELENEKRAIAQYRDGVDVESLKIGKTVFDSGV